MRSGAVTQTAAGLPDPSTGRFLVARLARIDPKQTVAPLIAAPQSRPTGSALPARAGDACRPVRKVTTARMGPEGAPGQAQPNRTH